MSLTESKELKIISLNISEKKGTIKTPVSSLTINKLGVAGDAHAGNWNRQISLLGIESIQKFARNSPRGFVPGEFAENITTEGMDLFHSSPLDRFIHGELILEVTQIGKKCHGDNCAIYREVGNCVMPKEGIFTRVIHAGELKEGDSLVYRPRLFKTLLITLSDRASAGEYEDKSGPLLKNLLNDFCKTNAWNNRIESHIIPDDPELLRNLLLMAKEEKADFIFTTGGTGIGPRDITPDVVKTMIDKEIPGIMDHIRIKYGAEKPNALLTRSQCGVMGESIIFTLPGSVKAVQEYMSEILLSIKHMKYMFHGLDAH
ncbi:MAG: molybdenum cofactor synthesis domain-containing protein [Bacteroidales bacterium]